MPLRRLEFVSLRGRLHNRLEPSPYAAHGRAGNKKQGVAPVLTTGAMSRKELVLKEGRDRCGYVGLSSPPQTPAGSIMFDPSEVKRQSTHHMIDQIGPV